MTTNLLFITVLCVAAIAYIVASAYMNTDEVPPKKDTPPEPGEKHPHSKYIRLKFVGFQEKNQPLQYSQREMIAIFRNCNNALDLLEARQALEETGHTLQWEAQVIYDVRMNYMYQIGNIA